MNLQKLLSVLSRQENNLKHLLQLGLDKKEVLVSNNYDGLNQVISSEEQCLLTIQLTEESRLNIMHDLFIEYKIDNERYKLEILLDNLKGKVNSKILNGISESEARIKEYIGEVTKNNSLNMLLIQQSKNLIDETIQTVISSNNRSILDRKG